MIGYCRPIGQRLIFSAYFRRLPRGYTDYQDQFFLFRQEPIAEEVAALAVGRRTSIDRPRKLLAAARSSSSLAESGLPEQVKPPR